MTPRRLGLVINPIAGMGGRVGLHGTDGDTLAAAAARGATPVTSHRAARVMARLRTAADRDAVTVLTAGGDMGAAVLNALEMPYEVVHQPGARTTAADTVAAVGALADDEVDLVLLVGGDGTLRDAASALASRRVAALGVPSGVKMHSSAFATSPEAAAMVAANYLADPDRVGLRSADVVDHTDDGPELFATLQVPAVSGGIQAAKSTARLGDDSVDLAALGEEIANGMQPGHLYLLGPGTTAGYVTAALGLHHSPLGVDAVRDGALIGADLCEAELLELLATRPPCTLVLGVVGGQGFLLGRGNQQLSPDVLAAIGVGNVVVLASRSKIAALQPPVLRVDVGDGAAEQPMRGYQRVRVACGHSTVLHIVS